MTKLQMGYDISTGEIIRTDCFTEVAKIPDEVLSTSSRRRRKKQQREQNQQKSVQTQKSVLLVPDPKSWNWAGMNDYLLLIRYWVEKNSLGGGTNIMTKRLESTIVAYLTLLFSMKEARCDQSDLVWVDRLEDVLELSDLTKPFITYIKTYRAGWSG